MILFLISLLSFCTGFYTLLIYVPFSFQQFIRPGLFPGVHLTMQYMPWVLVGLVLPSFFYFRGKRIWVWFASVTAMMAPVVFKTFSHPHPGVDNYLKALLFFSVAIAVQWRTTEWEESKDFEAQAFIGAVLAVLWSFFLRLPATPTKDLLWLFSLKGLVITILLALMSVCRNFVPRMPMTVFYAILYSFIFFELVFPSFSFVGPDAFIAALFIGAAFGLNLVFLYEIFGKFPRFVAVFFFTLLSVTVPYFDHQIARIDWNGTGLTFAMAISTSFVAILISVIFRGRPEYNFKGYYPLILGLLFLAAFQALGGFKHQIGNSASERLLVKSTESLRSRAEDTEFFKMLHLNSNVPSSTKIRTNSIDFGDAKIMMAKEKPHIFIFVIDSLRRDYVSAFNPSVKFTPRLQQFAEENLVFKNAFTRYGATGLSEPSIWAGALIPHRQYVLPFAPMNSLEKLIVKKGYYQLISMDEILSQILTPLPVRKFLDQGKSPRNFRLCESLSELQRVMQKPIINGQKIFAYSQAQDLHISTRKSGNGAKLEGSFDSEYAQAVNMLDECFGEFIEHLKANGIYDDSIVIFTADHGDSLGEEGRFGHSYTLYPEVVRIPLLMHLPERMREAFSWSEKPMVFNTDISPTLYALLEVFEERPRSSIFGVPFFKAAERHGPLLLASSYGPVFGLISEEGKELYLADGVQFQESLYHISTRAEKINLNEAVREKYREILRDRINELARFYNYEADN